MECSDLSLMREKKPEREGEGRRRCCRGKANQQRWCLSCCTVPEHLSSPLAAPEPPCLAWKLFVLLHIPLFQGLFPCQDLVLAGAAPNPLAPAMTPDLCW